MIKVALFWREVKFVLLCCCFCLLWMWDCERSELTVRNRSQGGTFVYVSWHVSWQFVYVSWHVSWQFVYVSWHVSWQFVYCELAVCLCELALCLLWVGSKQKTSDSHQVSEAPKMNESHTEKWMSLTLMKRVMEVVLWQQYLVHMAHWWSIVALRNQTALRNEHRGGIKSVEGSNGVEEWNQTPLRNHVRNYSAVNRRPQAAQSWLLRQNIRSFHEKESKQSKQGGGMAVEECVLLCAAWKKCK